ncbi:hypothetical protein ACFY0R_37665 [Streptomyces sp. NPDC001633]|uniref:hypothetical protein n=1 Tax=Streptomyces sp. NPDC001633 TaxID=3364595 RepID=UPI0036C5891D
MIYDSLKSTTSPGLKYRHSLKRGGNIPDRFIVYGFQGDDLGDTERLVSGALGVRFTARESSFRGGKYLIYRGPDRLEVTIESNFADGEGVLSVPEFPRCLTLIFVGHATLEVEHRLNGVGEIEMLRTELVD